MGNVLALNRGQNRLRVEAGQHHRASAAGGAGQGDHGGGMRQWRDGQNSRARVNLQHIEDGNQRHFQRAVGMQRAL